MTSKPETVHAETAQPSQDESPYDEKSRNNATAASDEDAQDYSDATRINLTWKSWIVVFVSCFAIMAQVFVVTAAGSVIAFIVRDIGNAPLSGWIIQAPLLMQSVLSPFVGRLSDVLDRKYLAGGAPLIAFAGAVVSARASDMVMLIVGGILIGFTLPTISIVQAIPSEVLPLKYRALANGFSFLGGAVGGLVGGLGAGGITNTDPGGWRGIFWMQAAFHLATSIGIFVFYWPKKHSDYGEMSLKSYIWAIDPIGSLLFISSTTLLLLALNWAGGAYPWSEPHVTASLGVGFGILVLFCLYEWKGRSDGMVAHVLFKKSQNFALATFAFGVEGWIFYSAVNSITPQMVLNLGFETNSWQISIRQLAYSLTTLVVSIPITLYATKFKDLKWPLVATFTLFLVVVICYGRISPSWSEAQIGLNILSGIGQSGPLTLLVALVQFAAPHEYLSTATGIAFSARAIGGAFGSAVLNAIINGKLGSDLAPKVTEAARSAGLPRSSADALLAALSAGESLDDVPGITPESMAAARQASYWVHTHAYRLAWWSILPFVALALVAVLFTKDVKKLMTERVEATVENVPEHESKTAD